MAMDGLVAGAVSVFAEEARDLLEQTEDVLLQLEDSPEDTSLINDLFRFVHTIKGAAGIFGFNDVVSFTHVVESVMGQARDGKIEVDEDLLSLMLKSKDQIDALVQSVLDDPEGSLPDDIRSVSEALSADLNVYLGETGAAPGDADESAEEEDAGPADKLGGPVRDYWHISLRFSKDLLRMGMDPQSFITYLHTLGDVVSITPILDALPTLRVLDPEELHLGLEIDLRGDCSKQDIIDAFEFIADDCELRILPPDSSMNDLMVLIDELPEDSDAIGEILVRSGAITQKELDEALNRQDESVAELEAAAVAEPEDGEAQPEEVKKPVLGDVLVEAKVVDRKVVEAAATKQQANRDKQQQAQQSVRVSSTKLGQLIDLVGELVISSAHAEVKSRQSEDPGLIQVTESLSLLVEEIRDVTLGLRMVQIGDTFNRFKRIVRDLSQDLNKRINLELVGGDTELDKTVVEKISDPLIHLVRNALDHGIEEAAVRRELGKPETATLRLEAYHDSGSIVIEIVDDGAGINAERVKAKAIDQGLIPADSDMPKHEIQRLIFEPGFSTAQAVTNISGRGVGMDVVRKNIDALNGHIDLQSEEGEGTKISVRLPLTLAIIDGFQVQVGNAPYIIPLEMVDECIELSPEDEAGVEGNYVDLRGEVMPYMHLAEVFGAHRSNGSDEKARNNIVVVQHAGKKTGLVVDHLLGEHQTVIKPLGKVFENLRGISGATILGTGDVAMILDVPALIDRVSKADGWAATH